jgi:hypothetical protein
MAPSLSQCGRGNAPAAAAAARARDKLLPSLQMQVAGAHTRSRANSCRNLEPNAWRSAPVPGRVSRWCLSLELPCRSSPLRQRRTPDECKYQASA